MLNLNELYAKISANFWKSGQIAAWATANFFRKNLHRQSRSGTSDANLPIILDSSGYIDVSFINSTDVTELIADTAGAMVTGNTETGITVTYQDADNTIDFVVSDEYIADTVGAMVTGNTETGITVTYQDADNTLDFELVDEYLQDTVGAMVTGNVETSIAVTYDDTNGKLDFAIGTHTHQDAAGGGQLDHGAALTGLTDDDHTQYLLAAGTRALSGDWDIGNGRKIVLERVDARDADGITFYDDGSNQALKIFDGGKVVTLGDGTGPETLVIDGAAGQTRDLQFYSGSTNRWFVRVNATAESGSNAGSDFSILSRTDAGAALRTDLTITRSNGNWTLGGSLQSPTIVTPTIASFANATHTHQNAAGGGQLDHGAALTGLTDDDHTQYALLAGRSGGQTLKGGTGSGDDLTLESTNHATKGDMVLQPTSGNVAIGTTTLDSNIKLTLYNAIFVIQAWRVGDANTNYRDWSINVGGETTGGFDFMVGDSAGDTPYGSGKSVLKMTKDRYVGVGVTPTTKLGVQAGTSTNDAAVGGVLYVRVTDAGNTLTGEDDLGTYSIPASTLATNGDSIWFEASWTCANNGNTKTIRMKYGATTLATISGTLTNSHVHMRGRIYRTGATTQRAVVTIMDETSSFTNVTYTTPAETLSGAVTIKTTGEATATDDIVMTTFIVGWDANNT